MEVMHGGRIGLSNWTPDSFIGQLFKTTGSRCTEDVKQQRKVPASQ